MADNSNADVACHVHIEDILSNLEKATVKLENDNNKLRSANSSLSERLEIFEHKMSNMELKVAQLEKIITDIIKSSLDYEFERSKVILYGLEKSDINLVANGYYDGHNAVRTYAFNFVKKYIPEYVQTDITVKVITSNDSGPTSISILMACSADALKLISRCKRSGFSKVSHGLTKLERQLSRQVSLKIQELNRNPDNVDFTYLKKHVHTIVKTNKDDKRTPLETFTTTFIIEDVGLDVGLRIDNMQKNTSRLSIIQNHPSQVEKNVLNIACVMCKGHHTKNNKK